MPSFTDALRGKGFVSVMSRQAERIGLGTAYAEVVGRVKRLVDLLGRQCVVVVDESGGLGCRWWSRCAKRSGV